MDHPTTPAAQLPAWQFTAQWRVLSGMAHGTVQPAMRGYCDVHTGGWDRPAWDNALAALLPGQSADTPVDTEAHDLALVRFLLHWSGAVQRHCKVPVFDAARIWRDPDPAHAHRVQIALPYASAQASQIALQWMGQVAVQLARGQAIAPAMVDAAARALQPFQAPGYNTIRFLQAAHALDLPWRAVVPGVIAYGQGRGSRWLESSYTEHTPVLGTRLARDKFRTGQVLRQLGLPAPVHARAASPEQAVQLARRIGYPVVVKPADRDQGQGVSADLRDDDAVRSAYAIAAACSHNILVEQHVHGNDYRMTVLNGRLIKTIVRRAGGVTGDGRHTVAELVARLRADPAHRRAGELRGHAPLDLDAEAQALLAQHAMGPHTVPAAGQFVALRRRANVSAGGTPELVVGGIHPDNQRLAERAALALQLDLAGVDIILPDIGRSWLEGGALVCEVNGQPQLGSSTTPGIYQQVLRALVPLPWRMPVVLVVDTGTLVARQLLTPLAAGGVAWGLACADGVWEGQEQVAPAQADGFAAARMLAASRGVAGAVVAMTPQQIMGNGLPFDRLRLLVVTAGATAQGSAHVPLDADWWRLVLAHVDGAVACARRHLPTVPTDTLARSGVPLHAVDDTDTGLLAQVQPVLAALLAGAAAAAQDGLAA